MKHVEVSADGVVGCLELAAVERQREADLDGEVQVTGDLIGGADHAAGGEDDERGVVVECVGVDLA